MGVETEVVVPDIGDFEDVEVIEVLVSPGDRVEPEDSLITIESDKASMEIPSPSAGVIGQIKVSIGDRVSEGTLIVLLQAGDSAAPAEPAAGSPQESEREQQQAEASTAAPIAATPEPSPASAPAPAPRAKQAASKGTPHAGPAVRRFARLLGADLAQVSGTGRKGRILKEDVHNFVKQALAGGPAAPAENVLQVDPPRRFNFEKFGEIEIQELSKIQRVSARGLHRSWVTIPHVTQFDEADITELEEYRKSQKLESERRGVKLTALTFLLKAVVVVLKEFPNFCSSLDETGEKLVLKRYYHIGVAVDTPNGLVVPVIREVDRKGLYELAEELGSISDRARNGKLTPADLSGGCFSISSLGGIGGTAFTPIVNGPEVAILGVSRHARKPIYRSAEDELPVPRLILPLSLSYDHRVIDGADAARFTTKLKDVLSDVRNLVL
ncbi:MAG: dihydrolipoyllysine-residue acetyltransferase [Myxococcota bacterium]